MLVFRVLGFVLRFPSQVRCINMCVCSKQPIISVPALPKSNPIPSHPINPNPVVTYINVPSLPPLIPTLPCHTKYIRIKTNHPPVPPLSTARSHLMQHLYLNALPTIFTSLPPFLHPPILPRRQHLHLPAQQLPQLGGDHLFLLLLFRGGRRRRLARIPPVGTTTRTGTSSPRGSRGGSRRRRCRSVLRSGEPWQHPRRGKVGFLVDGVDEALEALEEGLGADEGRVEVDCAGEFVDCGEDG